MCTSRLCLVVAALVVTMAVAQDTQVAIDEPKSVDEKKYLAWLTGTGTVLGSVDLANFTNPIFPNFKLRGVKATADIQAGQELLSVPGNMILSSINALTSPMGVVYTDNPQLFTDEQVLLSVFVLHELNNINASQWMYMLKVYPTRFHTAVEYSDAELRQLQGSPIFAETQARAQLFQEEFESLFPFLGQKYPHFFDLQLCSYTAYKYARLLVQTRSFGMHIDGRTVLGIVPFGDMFNHDPRAKIAWKFDNTDNTFRMYTEQPYARNTQIYNNYGPRSNRKLLLDFGFVLMDNPFDFVEMPAPVSSASSLDKSRILADKGLQGKLSFTVHLGELPDDLMFAARLARATPDEVTSYIKTMQMAPTLDRTKIVPHFNASISLRDEIAALGWLQDTASLMQTNYLTTYAEDVVQLQHAADIPRSAFNTLVVTYSEKRIYKFLEDFAGVHIPLLNYYSEYASVSSLTNARISFAGAEYMRNVLLPLQRAMLESAYRQSQGAAGDGSQNLMQSSASLMPN